MGVGYPLDMEKDCTKNAGEAKRGKGRPADPNKRVFIHMGLRPHVREYLKLWQSETGDETNFNEALERLIEDVMKFFPGGPMVEKPRDAKGRYLPGAEPGTSKMAVHRRRRREERERREREEAGTV